MSVQDLVDRRLVEWETRLQAKVLRNRDAIVQKNGREKYEAMLARAQELDEMASAAYREWTGLADQAPVENPSDQAAYVRGLNEAKKRALANVREPGVVRDVQERIDGELRDLVDAAVAFKGLKDQFGLLYGSPEDAIQEFMHRPEQMQGALSFVMGGFSDFRRFWDEIRPDVERLRKMNPEDDGAVEQAVAGSQLASAMGMLLSDTTSRMTVGAATGGDSREFVKSRFLKGLDEKDRAAVEANPEPFVDYAQARALYVQGAASAEQMASQAAKEGGTYRDALKQHGARLQALHEKLVEMREALPPLERDAALWLPPDAKGFQEDPGRVSTFFRGMARKALETINPFADQGQLALVAPRMEAPKHKAGFIPWNAQAWGEAVADLGISLPGFGVGGAAAGAVRLAKPIAQRAAQGAVAGGVGMLAQPGAVKEAAEGDVGALAGRGLGGAVAGVGLGAMGGVAEKAIAPLRASRAATREAAVSSEAAKAATPKAVQGAAPVAAEAPGPAGTAQERILAALKEAKPVRAEQEAAYSAERSRRLRSAMEAGAETPGEAGFRRQLSSLKGELPKVRYESVREKVTQGDIDDLFNQIEATPALAGFERISAKTGLAKLVGRPGVQVPTDSEMDLLGRVFGQEFVETVLAKRGTLSRALGLASQVIGTPRTLMASTDFSAPLRQGIVAGAGYPKQWGRAFGEMFRYARSDAAFAELGETIVNRPSYEAMRKGGLALSSIRGAANTTAREEQFMSTLAEKIPVFGRVVRGSERAHVGFLTKLRADIFDEIVKRGQAAGATIDDKFYRDAAHFINAATGRGRLPGKLENAGGALSTAFFSPRLIASRLEILSSPVTYMNASPVVRQEALRTLFNFTAAGTTILGLAAAAGVDVGTDPRSADFGKMKLGKTRVDIWGGFQQYPRLAAQLQQNEIKSSVTGKVTKLGSRYGAPTRKTILGRFAESKANPIVGFALRLAEGKDLEGKPVKVSEEVRNLLVPLVIQDLRDIYATDPSLLPLVIPAMFGVGVSTYPVPEKK